MEQDNWQIITFTLGVSILSTLLILPGGIFLAWLLSRRIWFAAPCSRLLKLTPRWPELFSAWMMQLTA